MIPVNTPTAIAEACLNFNTTTAIVTQEHPNSNSTHPSQADLPQERAQPVVIREPAARETIQRSAAFLISSTCDVACSFS